MSLTISPTSRVWRQALRHALGTLVPRGAFLTRGPRRGRGIALTFDDGPHPEETPRILDILEAWGAKATFFVIGQKAEEYPHLVRRILSAGHDVGQHSYSHSLSRDAPIRLFLEEVRQTRDILADILGTEIRLFRPPRGELSAARIAGLWLTGQTIVLWNVDPRDYLGPDSSTVAKRLNAVAPRPGDILLFHDNHPHAGTLLPDFLKPLRDREFITTRITEWISP